MAKQKIAILGGGTGAMSAAFGLTSVPGWQDRYDITVYQVGWRLGGKGASGRNPAYHQRIEEHGLHVWAGFYRNAFRVMRDCYQELNRAPGQPLATVWDAFKPRSTATLTEHIGDQWIDWAVNTPTNEELPGEATEPPTVGSCTRVLLAWILDHLEDSGLFCAAGSATQTHVRPAPTDWLWSTVQEAERKLREMAHPSVLPSDPLLADFERELSRVGDAITWLLYGAKRMLTMIGDDLARMTASEQQALLTLARELKAHLLNFLGTEFSENQEWRRIWLFLDFGLATFIGLLVDGVLWHGFASIDDLEWRDWLQRHGASATTANSVITRATYDYVFGYLNGDVNTPSIGAGTCTHGLMRLTMTYQGALFWEMQAGMGDTVFGPFYLVLQRRGVKFQFFHRVDALRLAANDRTVIDAIDLGVQIGVKGGGEYQPLVEVAGLPCWPSQPLFDQLDRGQELQQSGANLESPWANWTDSGRITLRRGVDFDQVVLGISVGALAQLTPELSAASPQWADMVSKIQTTPTQAIQVWLQSTAQELGWPSAEAALLTGYADDLNTWGDLSHLLQREDWPAGLAPRNESYFCGPLKAPADIPPPSDHGFPDWLNAQVQANSIAWLNQNAGFLLSKLASNGRFDWNQLVDASNAQGEARFQSQYWRGNIAPTERYVISAAGTTRYRLPPGGSGFHNLVLAGDWTDTAINAGCVEAAVMSGLAASRALCGYPQTILGEKGGAENAQLS